MTHELIASILVPFLITLLVTPGVIWFASKIGATDLPDARKIHTIPMPRIGGLAVVTGFLLSVPLLWFLFPELFRSILDHQVTVITVTISFLVLFLVGFRDDLRPLSAGTKFGMQFLLSSVLFAVGFQVSSIHPSVAQIVTVVPGLDYMLTVLWIVGITNSFNLIDGLDGLATGIATVATLSIAILSFITGHLFVALIAMMLTGSMVGFLRYNFYPASIFLGDSGSLVIGFAIAILSLQSVANVTSGVAILFPILILMLPIADTTVAMLRRWLGSFLDSSTEDRISPLKRLGKMFIPDKSHIHHRLLVLGLGHKQAVLTLYAVAVLCSIGAFLLLFLPHGQQTLALGVALLFIAGSGIKRLNYNEISILSNGLLKRILDRWGRTRRMAIVLLDVVCVLFSYGVSIGMLASVMSMDLSYLLHPFSLFAVILVQIGSFWTTGLYRERMIPFGVSSFLRVIRSVLTATGGTMLVLLFGGTLTIQIMMPLFVFNLYLLFTLVLGHRLLHEILGFWAQRKREAGENVLIYGADDAGVQMATRLQGSGNNTCRILGFLDDDPTKEGGELYGYPVFGGHWELTKRYLANRVHTIVICDDRIKREHLIRLRSTAASLGITVKQLCIHLEDLSIGQEMAQPIRPEGESAPLVRVESLMASIHER